MISFDLKRVDVPDLLARFHVRNMAVQRKEVVFSCPGPDHRGGDRTPSAAMNMHTTAWNCMSCGLRGNAVNFVAIFDGVSPMQALTQLKEWYGTDFRPPKEGIRAEIDAVFDKQIVAKPIKPTDDQMATRSVDWELVFLTWRETLEHVSDVFLYMPHRGFTRETLADFQVGYDRSSGRIAIPWFDGRGALLGWKARAVDPDVKPRYLVLGDALGEEGPYGFTRMQVSHHVWGIDRVVPGEQVIACEGELDAMMLCQQGHLAVSIAGSKISQRQVDVIAGRAGSVVLWFDSDSAGVAGVYDAASRLSRLLPTSVVRPHPQDPASSTAEQNNELLETVIGAVAALTKTVEVNPFATYEGDEDE